ncbi:spore photoproduct lyase family protein [Salinispira pacifica]
MTAGAGFSRIYVERQARRYAVTGEILARLQHLPVVEIDDYQEIYSRPRQSFSAQKRKPALVLAVKSGSFLYRGNARINSWQQQTIYYNDLIRNCIYDCEYCFLQGMHPSAHAVVNVNLEDYLDATARLLREEGRLFLSISYLTDLLGFEPIVPYTRRWIEFAAEHPELEIEIRTKSDNYPAIHGMDPVPNVVFVWSLAPPGIAGSIERGTAGFQNRLFAARSAAVHGFRLRLCFDPVVVRERWEEEYRRCVGETFRRLPAGSVEMVSVGGLRMGQEQFSRLRRDNPARAALFHPAEKRDGAVGYGAQTEERIDQLLTEALSEFIDPANILLLSGRRASDLRSPSTRQTMPSRSADSPST